MLDLERICQDLREEGSPLRQSSIKTVGILYRLLCRPGRRVADLLAGWQDQFCILYGNVSTNLSSNRKMDQEALLARYGLTGIPEDRRPEALQRLFFAIQTYFSLLLKSAAWELLSDGREAGPPSKEEIILGSFARRYSAVNYAQADWFCWPLFALDQGGGTAVEGVLSSVAAYRGPFLGAGDYIKRMYEAVIPRELRRALGEFYTPDWLAEAVVERALEGLDVRTAVLADPTCGSGTFLLQAIARKRAAGGGLREILSTVWGLDVNPLAVLAAKTNYLIAIWDLVEGEAVLPVYQADVLRLWEPVEEPSGAPLNRSPAAAVWDQTLADRRCARDLPGADLAVGNPPWVNWEYLPEAYRADSQALWAEYGLMSFKGLGRSFSKEDISALITCAVLDHLVKDGGRLAFVIRQGIFKSAQNGAGFRRFTLREGEPFKVLRVADLSRLRVFEDAAAGTAALYIQKGAETVYPVPYDLWERPRGKSKPFDARARLEDVLPQVRITHQWAAPAVEGDPSSVWLTAGREALEDSRRVLGSNSYRARTGVFTGGANAVYWLKILDAAEETVSAVNWVGRAKRRCAQAAATLEKEYLYPLVQGGGLRKWRFTYDTYLLCPHTAGTKIWPVPQEQLQVAAPKTLAYLSHFRAELDGRRGFAGWEKFIQQQHFHALLRVGAYTFAPYKVSWRYIASEFICAVISSVEDPWLGTRLPLPNEKIMYVAVEDEGEAYYLCGVLSSAPVAECVKSYMAATSISTHVLNKLYIPPYDPSNPLHAGISRACRAGHMAEDIEPYAAEVDALAAALYNRPLAKIRD